MRGGETADQGGDAPASVTSSVSASSVVPAARSRVGPLPQLRLDRAAAGRHDDRRGTLLGEPGGGLEAEAAGAAHHQMHARAGTERTARSGGWPPAARPGAR